MALKEFKTVKNDHADLTKQWFSEVGLDVYLWHDQLGDYKRIEVVGTYDVRPFLWLWEEGKDGKFFSIDEGEGDERKNLSPVVTGEFDGDYNRLLSKIEASSGDLPLEALFVFRTLA